MLEDKVIVVTGGAGLIGSRFCQAIVDHGGIAVVADVNYAAAEKTAQATGGDTGRATALKLDITDKSSLEKGLAILHARFGRVDGLVNNAYPRNKNYGRRLEAVEYADFCENLSLHLGGYFLASQMFSAYFAKQESGAIVNMSSIYGVMAPRFEIYANTPMTMPVEYAAIKSGVVHLTRYFAQYYKKSGVRVNAISPGGVEDGQAPSFLAAYAQFCGTKGMLNADDLTGGLMFLLSDNARFITGQNLVIDDGFSL
jgi:NAD(P)-dependent dehydrogenase (short-subunit alcohol dehydrogenase family)